MSITPNYPCLITSVEPDRSWEGFSATEKIPWLGVGGGCLGWGTKPWSCRGLWGSRTAGPLLFFLLLVPLTKRTRNHWAASQNRCLTTTWAKRNPSQTEEGRRGRESIRWPPLWECCKLCFPGALGIPHQSWNLRAWKTGPASPERGDVRCRTTSLDHLVWGSWQ